MRMRPIFSTNRSQSDSKKPDDDWQEQFFKLDVKYIVCQQVNRRFILRIHSVIDLSYCMQYDRL